jgi:hypothetical protein
MTRHRKSATTTKVESDKSREDEQPQRDPDPDTLEGPGGRQESKGESDTEDNATRQGER